ncbi:methionine ABC transporter ATP-binding protein [Uliginosibacterium gangwonense]|uniref:methionine ABC transporter ATP-binding protein n=1 Tax=Uliginosibacterium gangwonense TaxID=392736 RepID=UPI000377CDB2|nr:ATP-binding cassette domain-containing protein [Uliginosibacterium gangwonense]
MIDLRNISVRYRGRGGEVLAVNDVSLHIGEAQIYGIVGASGAGKSSLLRTINLLERPDLGQVLIDGQDITPLKGAALRQQRQKIGMVFQHFNLMHTSTVYDNAAFALRAASKSEEEVCQRVPEILELVGLSDKATAYPSQLSGGQKQRVGIARAIANRPAVLLCDEPTSALDLETAASILDLLREVNQRLRITIVLISHEMAVIKKICSRVAVMEGGKVVEEGDVYDIFASPKHPFTRQLVDHTLNLDLPAHLTEDLQGTLLKITFLGERAENPVLSETTLRFGVSVNILHGRIEYINGRALGLLVALLEDRQTHSPAKVAQAVDYITQNTAQVEVLHG